ncbi:MAG: hypothetical protein ABIK28_04355 [Planctomycetota bacterium]
MGHRSLAPSPVAESMQGPSSIHADAQQIGLGPTVKGLYYLRGIDPESYTDVGSLSKEKPVDDESTFCGAFIVFHYNDNNVHHGTVKIHNIYYHLWQKKPEFPFEGDIFNLGYNTNGMHTGEQAEWITIDTRDHVSFVDNYRLVQAMQHTDPEIACFHGDEIFNFEVIANGHGPRFRCHANQYSFVIVNVEDDETLKNLDRDQDQISDYEELFVYYTNPFDADTDNDATSDYEEIMAPLFGYPDSDPNDYTSTTSFSILVSLKPDVDSLPSLTGGMINFSLNAGAHYANRAYILLGSATGTSPGIPLPGGNAMLPLVHDFFTDAVIAGLNTSMFSGFSGTLDAMGHAAACFDSPPLPLFPGSTIYFAFACSDPFDAVSNPVEIMMTD